MKRTAKRVLTALLAAALLLSGAVPALAEEEPNIPYGKDIKEYHPDSDGYYALLPLRYEPESPEHYAEGEVRDTEDVYLPVLVYENTVYVRVDDFTRISGTYSHPVPDPRCCHLSFGLRDAFLFTGKTNATYLQGNPRGDGSYFGSLSVPLRAAPQFVDDVLWLPLDDLAIIFGLDPAVLEEEEGRIYLLHRARLDVLDVLANLTTETDFWTFYYDFWDSEGAERVSRAATLFQGLLMGDGTSVKITVKEMTAADVWGTWFMDSPEEDWMQMLTNDLTDMIVLTGADEAYRTAEESYTVSSELLSAAAYVFRNRGAITTQAVKPLLGHFRSKEALKKLGGLIANMEDPVTGNVFKQVTDGVGQALAIFSVALSYSGNLSAFQGRELLGQYGLEELLNRAEFTHVDETCVAELRKNLELFQGTANQYSLYQTFIRNGIGTAMDLFSLSTPLLTAYKLASVLVPELGRAIDATRSFQDAMLAVPLQSDAQDALCAYLEGFDGNSFTEEELRCAMRLSYAFLKICYATTRLAAQTIPVGGRDTSEMDQHSEQLLQRMSILSNAYRAADGELPGNLTARMADIFTPAADDLSQLAVKMYYTVHGEVREKGTEKAVSDAECTVTVRGETCGKFSGTPEGKYEVNIPAYLPEGLLPLAPESLLREVKLEFKSPTVVGEDSVQPEFDPGERVEAETAYLDWVTPQLKLIAAQRAVWQGTIPDYQSYYSYCISDMDNNHRLEITVAYMMGTGHFTDSTIFEVNDKVDGLVEVTRGEGSDESPDLINDGPLDVYRIGNDYTVIRFDGVRNGWAEYYEAWYACTLHKNVLDVTYLCGKLTQHFEDKPDEISFYDTAGGKITEAQYDAFIADRFAGLPKGTMTFGWRDGTSITGDLVAALRDSWEDFGCDLFEEETK